MKFAFFITTRTVFTCFLCSVLPAGDGSSDTPIYDPVTFKFYPHKGPVYSISASPFHRNLFASCSSDTTLRLHSALQVTLSDQKLLNLTSCVPYSRYSTCIAAHNYNIILCNIINFIALTV